MTHADDLRNQFKPAFREPEKDYFLRLNAEYNRIVKREARLARKAYWMNRITAVIKPLVSKPNLLHTS